MRQPAKSGSGIVGREPELAATARPLSVSRFRRCRSARMSAAVLVTQIAIFFQRLVDDVFELRWQVRIQPDRRDRRAIENRLEDQRRSVAAKWKLTGGHLVQHDAEGKQIRTRIEFFSLRLLRRHVGDGAQRRPGAGQMFFDHDRRRRRRYIRNCTRFTGSGLHFSEAEVENLGVSRAW